MKTDGHLSRCYLKGRDGDAANAILSAVGYNLRIVLAWLRTFLRLLLTALLAALIPHTLLKASF
jgi:IS5 family transposase